MTDYDFALKDDKTLTTNNWKTTDWIRNNAPEVEGSVTGSNYATITDKPETINSLSQRLIAAGFAGNLEKPAPYPGKEADKALDRIIQRGFQVFRNGDIVIPEGHDLTEEDQSDFDTIKAFYGHSKLV